MLTETYRKEVEVTDDTVSKSTDVELFEAEKNRRQQLLAAAGLDSRLARESKSQSTNSKLKTAEMLYSELTKPELRVWRRFLPTTAKLKDYVYDEVSIEALEAITEAREFGVFDRIEIWTPEGNSFRGIVARRLNIMQDKLSDFVANLDPMAVGIIKMDDGSERLFPIVRWGESLLPYEKVKTIGFRAHLMANLATIVMPVLLVLFGFAAFYNGIVHNGYGPMVIGLLASVACMAVSVWLTVVVMDLIYITREWLKLRRNR